MGTTCVYGVGHLSLIEFVRSQVESDRIKIVDHSVKGSTVYLACECKWLDGKAETIGMVCITSKHGDERCIKEVTECMGPYETECPLRIINKLSPTNSEYANQWRERCRAYAASQSGSKRLKVGQAIEFASPLKFNDGTQESRFVVTKAYNRSKMITAFQGLTTGKVYAIRGITRMQYNVAS